MHFPMYILVAANKKKESKEKEMTISSYILAIIGYFILDI